MQQECSCTQVTLRHELDLGHHTLFLMSDGSMDLLANDEQALYLADSGLHLDRTETYHLFISLQEQFKQQGQPERRGEPHAE
jgi:hypothetical protein